MTIILSLVICSYKRSYTYDGKAKTPEVTVVLNGKTLVKDKDYTVTYKNNQNVGTATVVITGIGAYTEIKEVNFTIKAPEVVVVNIDKAKVILSATNYNYDGKAKTPSVTITLDRKKLVKNTDYTVSYSNNKNIGTAKVTIKGKGNYTGTILKNNAKVTTVTIGANALKGIHAKATIKVPAKKFLAFSNASSSRLSSSSPFLYASSLNSVTQLPITSHLCLRRKSTKTFSSIHCNYSVPS